MKRYFVNIVSVFLLFAFFSAFTSFYTTYTTNAETYGSETGAETVETSAADPLPTYGKTCVKDHKIAEMIRCKLSEEEKALLYDTDNYDPSLSGMDLANYPILKVYRNFFWADADLPFEEMLSKAETTAASNTRYVVFADEIYDIIVVDEDGKTVVKRGPDYSKTRSSIKAIVNLSESVKLLGESCVIKNLYCFDYTLYDSVLFLDTDNGMYVIYYPNPSFNSSSDNKKPVTMTLEEYASFGKAYYDYIEERNWGPDGNPLYGGNYTFEIFYRSRLFGSSIGDVNADGEIDSADAAVIMRFDAGLNELDPTQKRLADYNYDGEPDSADANLILRYDAGL